MTVGSSEEEKWRAIGGAVVDLVLLLHERLVVLLAMKKFDALDSQSEGEGAEANYMRSQEKERRKERGTFADRGARLSRKNKEVTW